jgi:PAS domain-containing protein
MPAIDSKHYLCWRTRDSVNPAMAAMFGYGSAQEMKQQIADISQQIYVDNCDRDTFKRRMAQQDEIKDFEYQAYRVLYRMAVNYQLFMGIEASQIRQRYDAVMDAPADSLYIVEPYDEPGSNS